MRRSPPDFLHVPSLASASAASFSLAATSSARGSSTATMSSSNTRECATTFSRVVSPTLIASISSSSWWVISGVVTRSA